LRDWLAPALLLLLLSPAGAACRTGRPPMHPESPPGRWYVVQVGETAADIARRAGVPEEDLLEVNGIDDRRAIVPGKTIFVLDPAASVPAPGQGTAGAVASMATDPSAGGPAAARVQAPGAPGRLRWPLDAPRLTSAFGRRGGRQHEGIDLDAPTGTPVYAAGDGVVVYSGNLVGGYGNMIVLRHAPDLLTVYAHNSVLLVKVGDPVAAGQRVALSGQSGRVTAPHLHFEVRLGEVPRDPLFFLPRGSRP
jgi:lipoprotein NlpD